MNEGVYRSPKWLRNFVDFELHTGEDIKGKVSKKELKQKAERERQLNIDRWLKRWNEMDEIKFKEFYQKEFSVSYITSYDMRDIQQKWLGNFNLWERYDAWLLQEKKKKEDSDRITQELDGIFDRILREYRNYPYRDKYTTPTNNKGETEATYRFENGDIFKMVGNKIFYGGYIYTVGLTQKVRFVTLLNQINNHLKDRPGSSSSRSRSNGSNSNSGSNYNNPNRNKERKTTSANSAHPKWNVYNSIKSTITQREAQLAKMSKTDPERKALENELEAARRRVAEMKSKYKFENLISFFDFTLGVK